MNAGLELARIGRDFYRRGWVLGTSGNFSVIESREPLRITVTSSGVSKGSLRPEDLLTVDGTGRVEAGHGRPSAETALHLTIYAAKPGAAAVLHTHSVWSTLLSDRHGKDGRFVIQGYEMLKGLRGVSTHTHTESVPILANFARLHCFERNRPFRPRAISRSAWFSPEGTRTLYLGCRRCRSEKACRDFRVSVRSAGPLGGSAGPFGIRHNHGYFANSRRKTGLDRSNSGQRASRDNRHRLRNLAACTRLA